MSDWKTIWNRRKCDGTAATLAELLAADGFDQGAGKIDVAAWERYAELVSGWSNLEKGDSLFDVGCGAGAFIYPFHRAGHRVGGIDYSESLVAVAKQTMGGADFAVAEARDLNESRVYDLVVSNSVFHYFPDTDYAELTLRKMIRKAVKTVAVLELPDLDLQEEAEKARAGALPAGEYEKKYSGLRHKYYSRKWIEDMGGRYGCRVQIFDQQIDGYGNNRFRFNALFHKQN